LDVEEDEPAKLESTAEARLVVVRYIMTTKFVPGIQSYLELLCTFQLQPASTAEHELISIAELSGVRLLSMSSLKSTKF
jgi:hypothetical protein